SLRSAAAGGLSLAQGPQWQGTGPLFDDLSCGSAFFCRGFFGRLGLRSRQSRRSFRSLAHHLHDIQEVRPLRRWISERQLIALGQFVPMRHLVSGAFAYCSAEDTTQLIHVFAVLVLDAFARISDGGCSDG